MSSKVVMEATSPKTRYSIKKPKLVRFSCTCGMEETIKVLKPTGLEATLADYSEERREALKQALREGDKIVKQVIKQTALEKD